MNATPQCAGGVGGNPLRNIRELEFWVEDILTPRSLESFLRSLMESVDAYLVILEFSASV